MPPAHIFIVRHGERVDHANPDFGKTYPRPHDSPLTPNGVAMAEALGAYLVQHYHIAPTNTVVLTSPLMRCVQTSNGIVNGALRAAVAKEESGMSDIPIYLEPAIMEGAYWIFRDMGQNHDVVDPSTGAFHCPDPVHYDAAYHRASTSPYVQLTSPFSLYPPPTFVIEDNKLADHSFPERCQKGALELLSIPALDGKTVILVGHGETVLQAMYALLGKSIPKRVINPAYTAFVHLTCEGNGSAAQHVVAESETFSTPHLSEEPQEY